MPHGRESASKAASARIVSAKGGNGLLYTETTVVEYFAEILIPIAFFASIVLLLLTNAIEEI